MKSFEIINQLQEIKKNYICLDEDSRNVSAKKITALNHAIAATKRKHNSISDFWSGFLVCALCSIVYVLIWG